MSSSAFSTRGRRPASDGTDTPTDGSTASAPARASQPKYRRSADALRAIGAANAEVARMAEAYDEYHAAARESMRPGATAHDVHRAVSKGFTDRGYHLGHVTGHSIGMTMIEHPKIGEGVDTELTAGMVFSSSTSTARPTIQ